MFCAFEDNMLLDFLSLLLYPLSFPFIDSFIIDVQIISFSRFYVLNIKIWRFWLVCIQVSDWVEDRADFFSRKPDCHVTLLSNWV